MTRGEPERNADMTTAREDQRRPRGGPWPFGRRAQDQVGLTERQAAVLELVARGDPNKRIAASLGISEQGAKQDVSAVLKRFGLPSRAALVRAAITMKLLGTSGARDIPVEYLFDRAPLMIAMTSGPEHVFTVVNQKYVDFFGPRQYVGRPFRMVFPDLGGPVIADQLDAALRSGRPFRTDEQRVGWRSPDGVQREAYLALLIDATRDGEGTVGGLVFYGWDVTERVELRRRVNALAAERAAVIEQLPAGIIYVDHEGRPEATNAAARRLLGFVPDAGRALPPQGREHDARWAATGLPMDPANAPTMRALAGRPSENEVLLPRTGGGDLRVHISARPVRDAAGQVRGAVLVLSEVAPPRAAKPWPGGASS